MMLHLMNVSQSATLKDVEFIIDALLYQNISKLLIVITRADTVTKEQLDEVIKYTKSSIERQLKAQNKDSQLDYILKLSSLFQFLEEWHYCIEQVENKKHLMLDIL